MLSSKAIQRKINYNNAKIISLQHRIKSAVSKGKKIQKAIKKAKKDEALKAKELKRIKDKINGKRSKLFAPFVPADWKKQGLNEAECIFIAEYLTNGFNGRQAYKIAYPSASESTVSVNAYRILEKARVREIIQSHFNEYLASKKLKLEREIIELYYTQAFYDPSMFIGPDGEATFKGWSTIPKKYRCCVEGIEIKTVGAGRSFQKIRVLKLVDRHKALEKLCKYITLFKEDTGSLELKMTEETANTLANIFRGKK